MPINNKLLVLWWVGVAPFCAAQNTLSCITEMEVPQLRHAIVNTGGTVQAAVRIAAGGKLAAVDATATNKALANEIEGLLRYHTQFSPACAGEVALLDFTYVVEGDVTDDLRSRTVFRPPEQVHDRIASRQTDC